MCEGAGMQYKVVSSATTAMPTGSYYDGMTKRDRVYERWREYKVHPTKRNVQDGINESKRKRKCRGTVS